jgi:hypothetical protein
LWFNAGSLFKVEKAQTHLQTVRSLFVREGSYELFPWGARGGSGHGLKGTFIYHTEVVSGLF